MSPPRPRLRALARFQSTAVRGHRPYPPRIPRIRFLHRHHGDAVAAAFGRQLEIDDLGELLGQQWNEHLVQRFAQHGWFIWRMAGEVQEIDRIAGFSTLASSMSPNSIGTTS